MKSRIKMHQMPGDLPKRDKIALLERRAPLHDQWRVKGYRKMLRSRERAVLKERARKDMADVGD